jgi:AraC-like DNA-binding protein
VRRAEPITWEVQRAIRRDYAERNGEGWRYSLAEIAERNGVSVSYLSKIVKRYGLARYQTRGAA